MITPEDAPLAIFGTQATQSLIALLEETGIQLHAGVYAEQTGQGSLELRPTGEHIEVDRIVALPRLEGRPVDGLPADALGFLPIDEYARVRGRGDVWAAGDATDFPLKQGGIATQQADVAARAIAARAGAPVQPETFSPLLRGILLTGTGAWWLRSDPSGGDGEGELAGHALWWPPSKIAGRWLSPYLAKRDEGGAGEPPRGTPLEVRLAHSQAPEGVHGFLGSRRRRADDRDDVPARGCAVTPEPTGTGVAVRDVERRDEPPAGSGTSGNPQETCPEP